MSGSRPEDFETIVGTNWTQEEADAAFLRECEAAFASPTFGYLADAMASRLIVSL